MIVGLIITYVVVALIVGLFLKLNYDLEFYPVGGLHDISIDDEVYWLTVVLWPMVVPIGIIALGISQGYIKLKDTIEKAMDKRESEDEE